MNTDRTLRLLPKTALQTLIQTTHGISSKEALAIVLSMTPEERAYLLATPGGRGKLIQGRAIALFILLVFTAGGFMLYYF